MEQQRFVRKNQALFEAQRRQDKRRTRRTVLYTVLFIVVSLVFIGVCFAIFLRVESFEVNGNERYDAEAIVSRIPVEPGDNIFSFRAGDAEKAILHDLPYIGSIDITRDLPNKIVVNIEEEQPYYATDLAGEIFILSPALKVLERRLDVTAASTGLVELKLNSVRRCVVGEKIVFVDTRVSDAINELYGYFVKNGIASKITSLDVRSRFDIYLDYEKRFKVYVGDMENADIKIRFLCGIIDGLYPDSRGTFDISYVTEATYEPR